MSRGNEQNSVLGNQIGLGFAWQSFSGDHERDVQSTTSRRRDIQNVERLFARSRDRAPAHLP